MSRYSSRRHAVYVPKPMGHRWLADIARQEDNERPDWRQHFGDRTVEDIALQMLRLWVLKECDGCRSQAAGILGISSRSLQIHINRYRSYGAKVKGTSPDKYRVVLRQTFWEELRQRLMSLGEDSEQNIHKLLKHSTETY